MQNMNKKMLKIVYGDCTLGVSGDNFSYIFSYVAGGMESLVKDGIEWLFRCPKPAFWRALTDNDRGCGFQVPAQPKPGLFFLPGRVHSANALSLRQ